MNHGPGGAPGRRTYLDWLRGLAVLIMIAAHLFDSWTRSPDRDSEPFRLGLIVAGMGTVFFLMLAGVAVGLSAGSKVRRSGDRGAAAGAVMRRGLEIFALAFLFRLQALLLGWSTEWRDLLKVDILNIMGPGVIGAAFLWRLGASVRQRCWIFAAATLCAALLGPYFRGIDAGSVPAPLVAYFAPVQGYSSFVLFPWLGFVFAGALAGVLIDAARSEARERTVNVWLGVGGAGLTAVAYAGSYLPAFQEQSFFWTSSPAFFFMRAGVVTMCIPLAYVLTRRSADRGDRWSALVQLGRSSLFIYWIHVELLYGLVSQPLHRSLTLPQTFVAYVLFAAAMLVCSMAKDRLLQDGTRRWHLRLPRAAAPASERHA